MRPTYTDKSAARVTVICVFKACEYSFNKL